MIPYHGVLSEAHFRAVIRVGLRRYGFSIDEARYKTHVTEYWRIGTSLRDSIFPEALPGFANVADYSQVAITDPYLWSRLPWMAAAGYFQTDLFTRSKRAAGAVADTCSALGAAFHAAIVVLDFLVDERQGQYVLGDLDKGLIARLFISASSGDDDLAHIYRAAGNPAVRMLVALIGMCRLMGHELLLQGDNFQAWELLARTVSRMYAAQLKVVSCLHPSREDAIAAMSALKEKSVLPPTAFACIAALGTRGAGVPPEWLDIAGLLGLVYWKIDDLVDLTVDSHRGVPSCVLIRLTDIAREFGRTWATDGDIYDVVDQICAEIGGLLECNGRSPRDQKDPPSVPAKGKGWSVLPGALELASMRVAAWTHWEDEKDTNRLLGTRVSECGSLNIVEQLRLATAFLLNQQRAGYPDAVHNMTFPRAYASVVRMETHRALLFQRAVVLDALLDARNIAEISDSVIAEEVMAILRAKHRGVAGGWSYIPEVPELAPDADDLAVVLQALYRIGGKILAETCEVGLSLALEASTSDGSFPTWILDPLGLSEADAKVRGYLWIGGLGIHTEVVANLLFALHEYDAVRFERALRKAVAYFENTQRPDGFWLSRWYSGLFYGTYRVCSFLAKVNPNHSAIQRAYHAVLGDQRSDGGWGEHASDALSSSLALLTLGSALTDPEATCLIRAKRYILEAQEKDGGWPACLWGSFETGVGCEKYGSRTITTAFCLKALLSIGLPKKVEASLGSREQHNRTECNSN